MIVDEPGKKASFLSLCRSNYFKDIRPADPLCKKTPAYAEVVTVAQTYFAAGRHQAFRAYLAEGKYLANLWAAHLVLEYGLPDAALRKECIAVIERYADSPFDAALAQQELQWLEAYVKAMGAS